MSGPRRKSLRRRRDLPRLSPPVVSRAHPHAADRTGGQSTEMRQNRLELPAPLKLPPPLYPDDEPEPEYSEAWAALVPLV